MFVYAITDPSTLDFSVLDSALEQYSKKASMIVYRDKSNQNYAYKAVNFVATAKKFDFNKILIHSDYRLAKSIGADGVHLTSTQFNEISASKAENLFVIVSTHSLEEIKRVERLGADMVTFSPVFDIPNKGKAIGLKELKSVCEKVNIPVIALGGILTQEKIRYCKDAGAKGFASIRYFS